MIDTVSVIIATFGSREIWDPLAERALKSVYVQTRPADEIHRIHGNSLHEARNEGAVLSSSQWLLFCDADDELEPEYIEAMMFCNSATPSLRYPKVRRIHDPSVDPKSYPAVSIAPRSLYYGNYMVIGTLVGREQFLKLNGFRDLPAYEDWDLWIRCCKDGARPVLVPRAIYRAHVNKNGRNLVKNPGELCKQILSYNKINEIRYTNRSRNIKFKYADEKYDRRQKRFPIPNR